MWSPPEPARATSSENCRRQRVSDEILRRSDATGVTAHPLPAARASSPPPHRGSDPPGTFFWAAAFVDQAHANERVVGVRDGKLKHSHGRSRGMWRARSPI
jgi:hypothetical protein